uniref:ATP synthase complex subunit 8 n=1 Tax=Euterpnosia chibensis TaxID=2170266 RepID=A0A344ALG6_9HEMI|nr:ATP synthase F0 subunit 8 [Euterpnosia chibensis]
MPQMSPIYWLILMMYFIIVMMIMIMSIYFFFLNLPSKQFSLMSMNNSMNWMW